MQDMFFVSVTVRQTVAMAHGNQNSTKTLWSELLPQHLSN